MKRYLNILLTVSVFLAAAGFVGVVYLTKNHQTMADFGIGRVSTTTAPVATQPDPVVVAAGDLVCQPGLSTTSSQCRSSQIRALVAGLKPTAFLPLGDLMYDSGRSADFADSYQRDYGSLKAISCPTVGNHDYGTAGAAGYFGYFRDPNKVCPAEPGDQGYYSFDVGKWHLISLNANCTVVSCGAGSAQEQWLKSDLATHPNACTLAYWHQPRFSSGIEHGNDASTDAFWRDLYGAKAELVLNGHEHNYERFAAQNPDAQADANGIVEFVAGTGGRNLYTIGTPKPNSAVRIADQFGALKLVLHPTSYDWQFISESGQVLDKGSASCHK